ncbi:MAG: type II toxin-antitoxin system Phd/YefM family antitoxin [Clostridiales Family XIII bacterium]|jgi:PHD/YefM family antitoxin component YafN of YafNO toxin-antitoxin module|nr:type II toxin-antitoxin system Phd/YefM family antitoxin [Clostridiales Family XIII bacterium]
MSINANILDRMVPITLFNKGLASRIFDRLRVERQLIVLKNNQPAAVILSPEEYRRLSEAEEDLSLLRLAEARLTAGWEARAVPSDEFWKHAGVAEEATKDAATPEVE